MALVQAHHVGHHPAAFAARIDVDARRSRPDGFSRADARAALMALGRYALGWALDEQLARNPPAASEQDFEFGLQAMLDGLAGRRLGR